jgi:hypothetical protein
MPEKKPLSKAKAKKAVKTVLSKASATAKKKLPDRPLKPGAKEGNQNARKWTNEKLEALAKKMIESVNNPECFSICQVGNECGILTTYLCDLARQYSIVYEAYEEVRQVLSSRYNKLGAKGSGHGAFIMKMLPYYNKQLYDFDINLLKDQENTKADVRIREKRELGEKVDDGNGNVLDEFDEFLQWKASRKAKKDL